MSKVLSLAGSFTSSTILRYLAFPSVARDYIAVFYRVDLLITPTYVYFLDFSHKYARYPYVIFF